MANNNVPSAPPLAPQQHFNPQVAPMQMPSLITQTVMMPQLGGEPQRMQCPYCGADVSTSVKYQSGRMTHIAAIALCVFGCICCVCVPYCVESCQDAEHACPNCERHLGHYRR